MNERIKELRKALGLTQQEFADKVGIVRGNIAGYETGKRSPSDAVLALICREFNVNETWIRTGEGEMFVPISRDEQITDFVADILKNEDDSFKRRFVSMLSRLSEDEWAFIERKALELFAEHNKKDRRD